MLLRDLTAAVGRMHWSSEEELGGTPQCLLWEQNTETLEQLIEEASDTSLETLTNRTNSPVWQSPNTEMDATEMDGGDTFTIHYRTLQFCFSASWEFNCKPGRNEIVWDPRAPS